MKKVIFNVISKIIFTVFAVAIAVLLFWLIFLQAKSPKELFLRLNSNLNDYCAENYLTSDISDPINNITLEDLGYKFYNPKSQLIFSGLTQDANTNELITDNVTLYAQIYEEQSYLEIIKNESSTVYVNFDFVNLDCKDYNENMDIGWYVYAYDKENKNTFSSDIYQGEEAFTACIDITECSDFENVVVVFAPKQYNLPNDLIDIEKTEIALVALPEILR